MAIAAAAGTRLPALLALFATAAAPLGLTSEVALAQRPVIRCEIAGEIVYTDLTCAEADHIATELSPEYRARRGSRRAGEVISPPPSSDAPTPAEPTAATHVANALNLARAAAVPGRNPECPHLEQRMALVEAEGRTAAAIDAIRTIDQRLAVQRKRHRELGC